MTIEENVNKYLKISGITKKELSSRLGITYQRLWSILTHENITLDVLERIAKALDCQAWELLRPDTEDNTLVCPHCKKPIKINITIEQ